MEQTEPRYLAYEFVRIPRGKTYRALIRHLARFCPFISLATWPYMLYMPSPHRQAILDALQPDLVEAKKRSGGPGTIGRTDPDEKRAYAKDAPTVYVYRLSPRSLEVITTVANSLYSWEGPDYPDDFALLRENWESCLVALPADKLAWMYLTEQEKEELVSAVPVALRLSEDILEPPHRWWEGTEIEEE